MFNSYLPRVVLALLLSPYLCGLHSPVQAQAANASDGCRLRSVPVTILNNVEGDIPKSSLHVSVGDTESSIVSLERQQIVPRVILLLDTSGSMASRSGNGWGDGLQAAALALHTIPPESKIALITFNDQIHVSQFEDRQTVYQRLLALRQVQPRGRTALYRAIRQAAQIFGAPQFGDVIYIVSDGGDDYGRDEPKDAAADVISRGIRAFAFVVRRPEGSPSTPEEREGPTSLIDFVKATGGNYLLPNLSQKWIDSPEGVQALKSIGDELQVPLRMDLQLSAPIYKTAKLKITSSPKDLKLSYPQNIEPCTAPPHS